MNKILYFAVLGGTITAIIGIAQYLGWGFYWIPAFTYPSATFANRNLAAMVMILLIPMGAWLFTSTHDWRKEFIWGFFTAIMIIYLIYTRTRGAWLGLSTSIILAMGILLFIRKKRNHVFTKMKITYYQKRKNILLVTLLLLVIVMSQIPPSEKIKDFYGTTKVDGVYATSVSIFTQDNSRIKLWQNTLKIIKNKLNFLTGIGLNNFQFLYPKYSGGFVANLDTVFTRPHNDYLWILIETGIIGFFVYIWLLLTIYWMVIKIIYNASNPRLILLTITLATSLTAILGHAFFSFPKERVTPSLLFWIIIAFISILYRQVQNGNNSKVKLGSDSGRKSIKQSVQFFLIVILIPIAVSATHLSYRWIMNDHYLAEALNYKYDENYPKMISALSRAEIYGHLNYQIPFLMGIGYIRTKEYDKAINAFKQSLKEHPNYLNAHYNLGVAYGKLGDNVNAAKQYLDCIIINPTFYNARFNLAVTLQKLGMDTQAKTQYEEALEINPKAVEAYNNLGIIYKTNNNPKTAKEMFEKALQIKPDYQKARENLMNIDTLN